MFQIEAPVRLSASKLWELNLDFYANQGLGAWSEGIVPTRITSNPMIANAYAEVIAGYLRDVARAGGAKTVTIVELGAGSGQFSFLLLRALDAAVGATLENAEAAEYRFLMTDFAESNVRGWRENEKFRPFLDSGALDLGVLDVGAPEHGRSLLSKRPLADVIGQGPVVVIANYLWDSLVCDAFGVEDGKLYECAVGLDCEGAPEPLVASARLFRRIRLVQKYNPASASYYPEPAFNAILAQYAEGLRQGTFLFPIVGLRFLDAMRRMAPAGVMMLAADKGYGSLSDYEGRQGVEIRETGAFSSMVNFDAIGRWAKLQGGQVKAADIPHDRLAVYAFVLGESGQKGETELAFRRAVATGGPNYLHWVVGGIGYLKPELPPRALLGVLELSRYDPEVLVAMGGDIGAAFAKAEPTERAQLKAALGRCLENHFDPSPERDPHFAAGKLYQSLGEPQRALQCFLAAKAPLPLLAFNIAMCRLELGDAEGARAALARIVEQRPAPSTG